MEQLEFFSVPSPCVGVCALDEKGYCKGCMRKREERFNWQSFTPAQQKHIIKLCRQRYFRKQRLNKSAELATTEEKDPQQSLFDPQN